MFHGNQWGWRAAAVRLLLAPVVAGVAAAGATAQVPRQPQANQATARNADPKELLKLGREAMRGGNFDRAQELAKQADANNPAGRWGLFDDTPEALEKDIAAGRAKAGRAEADRLARAAKELYAKPTKTPGERIANLDQAHALADKAMTLAGPGDFFDDLFGSSDRPEKLKKDIAAAQAAVRKANPGMVAANTVRQAPTPGVMQAQASGRPMDPARVTPAGGVPSTGISPMASSILPAGGIPAPILPPPPVMAGTADADRQAAVKLVADGREMLKAGQYAEAKAAAVKAQALNVRFAATQDSPDALARDAAAAGKARVDKLVRDAGTMSAAGAETALTEAKQLAAGLGFQSKPIDDQLAAVRSQAAPVAVAIPSVAPPVLPNPAAAPAAGLVVPPALDVVVPPPGPMVTPVVPAPALVAAPPSSPSVTAPSLPGLGLPIPVPPPAAPVVVAPTVPAAPVVPAAPTMPGQLTGPQLLDQARASLKSGDLGMARKLAAQAHNASKDDAATKADAQALMREITAETYGRARQESAASFKNAAESFQTKQYEQALATLRLIDPDALTTDQKAQYESMTKAAAAELAKTRPAAATGQLTSAPAKPIGADGPADSAKAMAEVEFGKLRSEGLDTEVKARELYNRGETDAAILMYTDFLAKVKASGLSSARQDMLTKSIENKLATARIMKRQTDFYAQEANTKTGNRDRVVGKQLAEQQKHAEIKKKTVEINELAKVKKFREAEELALQTQALDPADPTLTAIYEMTKRQRRVDEQARLKGDREQMVYDGLTGAERVGPTPTDDRPLIVNPNDALRARMRGDGSNLYMKPMTEIEREIEVKLERPLNVEFSNKPLREAITEIKVRTGLNITTDDLAIAETQIPIDTVMVTESLKDLSTRNILSILLDKARLKYVVENNVVRITTEKRAQGRMAMKTFSVMELVTPIPDFALADHQSISKALGKNNPKPAWVQQQDGSSVYSGTGGQLGGAKLVSGGRLPGGMDGATLDTTPANTESPLADSATLATHGRSNHSAQLIKLVTGMVRPYSWEAQGGAGKIGYYDIGGALVVNQTADVIGEVQQLLESLRRLQEVSVSVEIRVVSLSESFFERIGVDFALNIKTKGTENFERSLTTGQFRPEPYINDINVRNVNVGYNPTAGGFTPDLDVPVRTNSFGLGIPPFGGYPGPGNGGLSLGMAFLNDIQVFMFLEAASGDRRVNIMQAPKITLFNGQTSTVFVSDFAFFTTGLDVINVGGQFVYIPRNQPIPIGNSGNPDFSQQGTGQPGVTVTVQAIVSADRRFVRLNLSPTLTSLTSATVPLFPVTAFITPVFEGGSQGVPIPFTQFFQQPSISEISVQTTVAVPDGGTVVLGGLKTLAEGRNEFGPPVLSQIPYINRLFRNQGIGRETRHIMIMVTPRIIIQSEEELNQTGGGVGLPGAAQ